MPHPEVLNRTPFAFAPLFVADEDGRPLVATIVKATFDIGDDGALGTAARQEPVDFAGKFFGEPGKSSWRREPEVAFEKPGTDCVLLGHAAAARPVPQLDVGIRIGALQRTARVFGDRRWDVSLLGQKASPPQPFERLPLLWERAFGGWDRTPEREELHQHEPRNPLGVGFVGKHGKVRPGAVLPNIEGLDEPMRSPTARPAPAGFGFTGPAWQPRARFAGTCDAKWEAERAPLLPKDFDRRFFQAAPDGLWSPVPLRGDEPVVVVGTCARGRVEFRLPGIPAPRCEVHLRNGDAAALTTRLDTVIVDTDAMQVVLLWRAHRALRQGPHEVAVLRVTAEHTPPTSRRPAPAAAAN